MGISFSAQDRWFQDARCIACKGLYELDNGDNCGCDYGWVPATGNLSFDMSYGNAGLVLSALGFEMDDCTVMLDPVDVLVAVNQVRGRAGEFTRETVQDGNLIQCGYGADVIADRFERFVRLAHYALEEGVMITGA